MTSEFARNRIRRRILAVWAALAVFVVLPCNGNTQEDVYSIALFTPNLDFKDGVARNSFVTEIAATLSDQTAVTWTAKAFARQADFESELRKEGIDLAIIDGVYFAAKGSKMTPIASLKSAGGSAESMKVYVRSGVGTSLHELRGKKLVIAESGGYLERIMSGEVLGAEIAADEFFSEVQRVKDVRSAINALELGNADVTMAYGSYAEGLKSVFETPEVPLPVIAITSKRLDGELLDEVKKSVRKLTTTGAGMIAGAGSYNGDAVRRIRSMASKKRTTRTPELIVPKDLVLEVGRLNLPTKDSLLEPIQAGDVFMLPDLNDVVPDLEATW